MNTNDPQNKDQLSDLKESPEIREFRNFEFWLKLGLVINPIITISSTLATRGIRDIGGDFWVGTAWAIFFEALLIVLWFSRKYFRERPELTSVFLRVVLFASMPVLLYVVIANGGASSDVLAIPAFLAVAVAVTNRRYTVLLTAFIVIAYISITLLHLGGILQFDLVVESPWDQPNHVAARLFANTVYIIFYYFIFHYIFRLLESRNEKIMKAAEALTTKNAILARNEVKLSGYIEKLERAEEELAEQVTKMERLQNYLVGREVKMAELKQQIEKLEAQKS